MNQSDQTPLKTILISSYVQHQLRRRLLILLVVFLIGGLFLSGGLIFLVSTLSSPQAWLIFGGVGLIFAVVLWIFISWLGETIAKQLEASLVEAAHHHHQETAQSDKPLLQENATGSHGDKDRIYRPITSEATDPSGQKIIEQVSSSTSWNNEQYRLLIEHATDMISHHTLEGKYLYVSPASTTLIGYSPEELIGRSAYEFFHPDDWETIQRSHSALSNTSKSRTVTYRMRHKAGHYIWFETTSQLIMEPNARVSEQIIVVSRDITERKQIEREFIQRNNELTVLQNAGVAITSSLDLHYVLDTVVQEMTKLMQIESCVISEWRQADNSLIKIAGFDSQGWWDRGEKVGPFLLNDFPITKAVLQDQTPEQMTISEPYLDPAEKRYMQDKEIKTIMMLPMAFHKQVIGLLELTDSQIERRFTQHEIALIKFLADQAASSIENARLYQRAQDEIVERQRAEAALEQERASLAQRVQEQTADLSRTNTELARISRLKDQFLAGMSHELRTPLNTILGSSEILQLQAFGELSDKQMRYTKAIEESGRHLLSLINDILDISKAEAGHLDIEIGPVSVEALCQASLQMVKQLAHKKQLKLSYTPDERVSRIFADERRLKQVLVNLLSNAVKFTPEGGEIGLGFISKEPDNVIEFIVWDSGIGIAPEDIKDLFEPFVQVRNSNSKEHLGTGLGLALVSTMVELHGGSVTVDSEVGKGSRFTVRLPWAEARSPEPVDDELTTPAVSKLPTLAAVTAPAEQPLLLLVDDNETNINMLADYLEVNGYRLIIARTGYEALDRVAEEPPDVILMDAQMPGMDGLETTRRLKANPAFAHIPIIMVTVLATPGDRLRCLEAGANDYFSKPVNVHRLLEAIEAQRNASLN